MCPAVWACPPRPPSQAADDHQGGWNLLALSKFALCPRAPGAAHVRTGCVVFAPADPIADMAWPAVSPVDTAQQARKVKVLQKPAITHGHVEPSLDLGYVVLLLVAHDSPAANVVDDVAAVQFPPPLGRAHTIGKAPSKPIAAVHFCANYCLLVLHHDLLVTHMNKWCFR